MDFFCGYTRVQVKQFECNNMTGCPIDSDWLTLVECGLHARRADPGPGGDRLLLRLRQQPSARPTTTTISSSRPGVNLCFIGEPCTEWTAWDEVNREPLVFKHLYEGGLIDYSAGRKVPNRKIDVATTPPDPLDNGTYCDGWKLLVDLPDPIGTSDTAKVSHYLQDTATAVDFLSDGAGQVSAGHRTTMRTRRAPPITRCRWSPMARPPSAPR